jgi:hypothetical protein
VTHRWLLAAGVLSTLIHPAVAGAAPAVSLEAVGEPSYITLSAHPGAHTTTHVRLTNLTARPVRVQLTSADVGVAEVGGLSYGSGRPRATGTWLHPLRRSVRLGARQQRIVPVAVSVPARVSGGDHYAALTAALPVQRTRSRSQNRTINMRFVWRLAIAVRVRLPGPRHAAMHVGQAWSSSRGMPLLTVPLANRGSALLAGAHARLSVTRGGRRLFGLRQTFGAFVPDGHLAWQIRWPVKLSPGRYRLDGAVTAAGKTTAIHQHIEIPAPKRADLSAMTVDAQHAAAPATPWSVMGLGLLAAMGVGALLGARVRRR